MDNKKLLLTDLCPRLPYGVKCKYYDVCEGEYDSGVVIGLDRDHYVHVNGVCIYVEEIKPYLFPLSSISDEILDEIYSITGVYDIGVDSLVHIEVGTTFEDLTKIFDILNKHHIDYRGMIPKGLAVDATNLGIYGNK